jgi:hypothetical protein
MAKPREYENGVTTDGYAGALALGKRLMMLGVVMS